MKHLSIILTLAFLVAPSVLLGQDSSHEGHDHGPGVEHSDHDEPESVDDAVSAISPQALKNMGVKIEEIDSSNFTLFLPVPARVESRPLNLQPVYAPFSGRIEQVLSDQGAKAVSGDALVTIMRDPIPRPSLAVTAEMISPASEEFHGAVAHLRSTRKSLDVLSTELQRLEKFQGDSDNLSILPQKDLIDLKYQYAKVEQDLKTAHEKLLFHGLTVAEIATIESGGTAMRSDDFWLNALRRNGAWNSKAAALRGLLQDDSQRQDMWVGATIAELALTSLISDDLLAWLEKTPAATSDLLKIATLLQEGHSLPDIQSLFNMGALTPIISVRAPASEHGWDIRSVDIKIGQRVAAGAPLLLLENESDLYLVADPNGSEISVLNDASREQHSIDAIPLTPGTGPELSGLTITKMRGEDSAARVYLPVANTQSSEVERGAFTYRNWALRAGMKYILKVPTRVLEDVIVLPSEAVIQYGPDKVVFAREHGEYVRRKVVVVYQDNEVAVIGEGSDLLPEEPTVTKGAFALHLALIAGTPAAVDPHAGHNH